MGTALFLLIPLKRLFGEFPGSFQIPGLLRFACGGSMKISCPIPWTISAKIAFSTSSPVPTPILLLSLKFCQIELRG
jgi:hypothetical protein